MIARLLLLIGCVLALAGCGEDRTPAAAGPSPTPLLYEVSDSGGAVRGWLFGTIHALPDETRWRTGTLENAIDSADLLLVEIADLTDTAGLSAVFSRLATSPGHPPLTARVGAEDREAVARLVERSGRDEDDFANVETWAAALMLAQIVDTGNAANGADRAIIAAFAGRNVRELEGAEAQLRVFDRLPESDQIDLLEGVIDEIAERAAQPEELRNAWLAGDEAALIEASNSGILADPELRQALLVDRNRAWIDAIVRTMDQGDRPLVAVGAAHLVGPDGLARLLQDRGFTVARIQ